MTDYKQHFDNGPIPMWIIDAKTMQFLEVNNAAIEKYGYSREEFCKMTIIDIRPEEDVPALMEFYAKKDCEYYDGGYRRHQKKDGTIFFVHIYCHPTEFGDIAASLCFAVDINDKVLAEKRNTQLVSLLHDQKEELNGILTSLNDAIWSRTADTHQLIYGNKAYFEMYGIAPEEMDHEMTYIFNSVYPPDNALLADAISQVQREGKTEVIYRHVHKDGRIRALKVQAKYKKGMNGQPDIITGITTDITQEKDLFDAIRNSEQKLHATINNTKDLIWSVGKDLKIIYCNKAFQDFFLNRSGVALDEGDDVLGHWNSASFIDRRKKDYQRALSGESFTTVIEDHFNGFVQFNEISSNPIIDHDGRIIGVNCIARDITAQRRQLTGIREQNEKIKEIARKKTHMVKQQVAGVLGAVSQVHQVSGENVRYNEALGQLNAAADELEAIIKDLIAVSKNIDLIYPDTEDVVAKL